ALSALSFPTRRRPALRCLPFFPTRRSSDLLRRRRQLFGAIALRHVDHGLHRRGEFVDIAHLREIALRDAAERFRRDAVKQDEARSEDTRLNSSHDQISYAVFCLKKKKQTNN